MKKVLIKYICVGLLMSPGLTATAADGSWTGGGSDNLWTNTANWDIVPGTDDIATVDTTVNNPLVNMDVPDVYNIIYIGKSSVDEVTLTLESGGYLRQDTSAMYTSIAHDPGSKARLDMTGGTISGRDFIAGQYGSADINVSGGTIDMARNFYVGDRDGTAAGTVDISGGIVDVGSWTGVGVQSGGMQTMTVSGNGYLETGHLSVGLNDGLGTLNISGNGHVNLDAASSRLRVGEGSGGATGIINMDGGTLEVDSYIALGYAAGQSGTMNMTAGNLSVNAIAVGLNGPGTFDLSGGNIVLNSHVRVGEGAGQGIWTMSGGLVVATNYVCVGWGTSAGDTDVLTMTGGEIRTGDLRLGRAGDGRVNLSGGTISVNVYGSGSSTNGFIFDELAGNGVLNMAGGTLNWTHGDFTAEVNALVASNSIVAYSGYGTVNVAYDAGSTTTVVTATAPDGVWTGDGADNLWTTSDNWTVSPSAGDNVIVDLAGNDPVVDMNVADIYETIDIGMTSTEEVTLTMESGGYLRQDTSTLYMVLASGAGSKARLDMTGGTISCRDFLVGQRGAANVNMSDGTIIAVRNLGMGDRDGHGVSTFDLSGGTVDVSSWTGVGVQSGGMQTMTVNGTGYLETGHLSVGVNDGQGTLHVAGSGHVNLVTASSRLRIGEHSGSTGMINMDGGTLEVDSYIAIGYASGGTGIMDMTDGDVSVNAFVVGLNGSGTFDLSGGTLDLISHVRIGEGVGQGTWNMSGGLVEAPNYITVGWGTSAGDTDILNVTGGEIRVGDLQVGRYGDGTVNLSGGVVNVNYYNNSDVLLFDTDGGDGILDITEGTLNWLHGNYTNEVNALVSSGDITAFGGMSEVRVVYDSVNDKTVVTADAIAYELWAQDYGLSGDDAATTNDYDEDGLNNLYEYGLGGDPTNSLDLGYPCIMAIDGSWLYYGHPQLSDVDSGLVYYLELTDDLVTGLWTNMGYTVTGTNTDGYATGIDAITNQVSTAVKDAQFIRLVIEED